MPSESATFLTLPRELRNAIYLYVFDDLHAVVRDHQMLTSTPSDLSPKFDTQEANDGLSHDHNAYASRQLSVLRTCKQIHAEAHLMALSMTPFHITGDCSYPDLFDLRSRPLSPAKIGAIRHLTLTARISHLRALNEAWAGLPFGHPCLQLDVLTIKPRRPDCSKTAYAEVADLSQSHTLAYIFAETLKGLRNVRCVEVRNEGCFNDVVWRIVYRSLLYRLWRWGGDRCGVRFEASQPGEAGSEKDGWFKVYLHQGAGHCSARSDASHEVELPGKEAGEEVMRLAGGEMPDPNAGVGP